MPPSPELELELEWTPDRLAALARAAERSFFHAAHGPDAPHPELVPPGIEGYEILRLIGSGGMGSVWLAREDDGEEVAVKILHASWARDPGAAARFEGEVDALAALDHPGIVRLLDAGETSDGHLFLATEHVAGCDLRQLMRGGLIPAERALEIFGKVARAIAHAHACGIIHRDLKPANILVGAGDLVKVTDFGLAKRGIDSATRETDAFGSPYYLAPELTRSAAAATPASDVYSLGVLLYELLSGKLPLGSYTPLSSSGLDRRFDPVIQRALRDDPSVRTATADELLGEVERIRHSRSARGRWKARAPWLAAAALAIAGPLAGVWWEGRDRTPPRPVFPAPETAARDKPWSNSLGMAFIPVEGTEVLFSVHETRNAEWLPFREVEASMIPRWRESEDRSAPQNRPMIGLQGLETPEADLSLTPGHPAQGVSWQDARFFCNWLTIRERGEGRIGEHQYYRLPTDREWSIAAGLTEPNGTPQFLSDRLSPAPPALPGNFAGPEARTARWPEHFPTCERRDPFAEVAPAASFPASTSGLFDLGGNVLEWIEDDWSPVTTDDELRRAQHFLRGGSWATGAAADLRPDHRFPARPNRRRADYGFRCVLVVRGNEEKTAE